MYIFHHRTLTRGFCPGKRRPYSLRYGSRGKSCFALAKCPPPELSARSEAPYGRPPPSARPSPSAAGSETQASTTNNAARCQCDQAGLALLLLAPHFRARIRRGAYPASPILSSTPLEKRDRIANCVVRRLKLRVGFMVIPSVFDSKG